MYDNFSWRKLVKIAFIKIFTNNFVDTFVNILLPCVLSIHCAKYTNNNQWWYKTVFLLSCVVTFNILSVIIKQISNKNLKQLTIIYNCYAEQSIINSKFATNIFRLNKMINECIASKTPINKKSLGQLADFQSFSFSICESIHKMLCQDFGKDISCEVTLMKKENTKIKMIAYANENNHMPSTYRKVYNLKNSEICFIRLFNDLNAEIICYPDKKAVEQNFKFLDGSAKREKQICQFIGIPVKTNRNQIEFLLQIDVAKPKVFGKTKEQMQIFAKNVLYPYAMLLHKSYERDLVFNQYYDMITSMFNN